MSVTPVSRHQDDRLLSAAYEGDLEAFETLFHRHYQRVYGVLLRIVGVPEDAEELALDVFLNLYSKRLNIDESVNVSGWLYRTATNAGFNAVRSRKRRFSLLDRFRRINRQSTAIGDDPLEAVERNELAAEVRAVLASMPERQRNVLILRASGLKYAEIATALEVKPSSVGQILARAETAFRQHLQDGANT